MLAPGPQREPDEGLLEGAGKELYLKSLESRLNKLQGANKKQLTSKDILQSLGEAKDDHMLQLVDREPLTLDPWGDSWGGLGSAGRGRGGGGSGSRRRRETPSSIENEFADVDLGSREEDKGEGGGGGGGGGDGEGEGEGEVERGGYRVLVGEEEGGEERPPGVWLCCLCFKGPRYGRSRVAVVEEEARLVDCDELSLQWQSSNINVT